MVQEKATLTALRAGEKIGKVLTGSETSRMVSNNTAPASEKFIAIQPRPHRSTTTNFRNTTVTQL